MTVSKKTPAKKPAKKAPAKRRPAKKKPVKPVAVSTIDWKRYATIGAASLVMLAVGAAGGVWSAGGIDVSPGPARNDGLAQAHAADRVSQIRILREYAGQTFTDEPAAQAWLNNQRIEARRTDWIPYTDELGAAADQGVDAVKALADRLEGK